MFFLLSANFNANKYKITMEGQITVIEAVNGVALDQLYEVANRDAAKLLNDLLRNKQDDAKDNNTNTNTSAKHLQKEKV